MAHTDPGPITALLAQIADGDGAASNRLLKLVYGELRSLAAARMARLPPGNTLQPTALVHDAWLRIAGRNPEPGAGRSHFFATAARAMRDILVEQARRKAARKRGGDRDRVALDGAEPVVLQAPDDLLDIDEALRELERDDPGKREIVNLRYFAGLSTEETAAILGVSTRTVEARWQFIRRWLFRRLKTDEP